MTREQILQMEAGEELDRLCAWGVHRPDAKLGPSYRNYSTDPAASAMLEDKLHEMGWGISAATVGALKPERVSVAVKRWEDNRVEYVGVDVIDGRYSAARILALARVFAVVTTSA